MENSTGAHKKKERKEKEKEKERKESISKQQATDSEGVVAWLVFCLLTCIRELKVAVTVAHRGLDRSSAPLTHIQDVARTGRRHNSVRIEIGTSLASRVKKYTRSETSNTRENTLHPRRFTRSVNAVAETTGRALFHRLQAAN